METLKKCYTWQFWIQTPCFPIFTCIYLDFCNIGNFLRNPNPLFVLKYWFPSWFYCIFSKITQKLLLVIRTSVPKRKCLLQGLQISEFYKKWRILKHKREAIYDIHWPRKILTKIVKNSIKDFRCQDLLWKEERKLLFELCFNWIWFEAVCKESKNVLAIPIPHSSARKLLKFCNTYNK